jgi:hypothetical protein
VDSDHRIFGNFREPRFGAGVYVSGPRQVKEHGEGIGHSSGSFNRLVFISTFLQLHGLDSSHRRTPSTKIT